MSHGGERDASDLLLSNGGREQGRDPLANMKYTLEKGSSLGVAVRATVPGLLPSFSPGKLGPALGERKVKLSQKCFLLMPHQFQHQLQFCFCVRLCPVTSCSWTLI